MSLSRLKYMYNECLKEPIYSKGTKLLISLVDCISNCTRHIIDDVIGIYKLCTALPFSEELNEVHITFINWHKLQRHICNILTHVYLYAYILYVYLHIIPIFTCISVLAHVQSTTGSCAGLYFAFNVNVGPNFFLCFLLTVNAHVYS